MMRINTCNGELYVGIDQGLGIAFPEAQPILTILEVFCKPTRQEDAYEQMDSIHKDDARELINIMVEIGILNEYNSNEIKEETPGLAGDIRLMVDLADTFETQKDKYFRNQHKLALSIASSTINQLPSDDGKKGKYSYNAKRLNLGCGTSPIPGWVNLDLNSKDADINWDLRWPLPFKDKSVQYVYCSHVLEHLEPDYEARHLLNEIKRILKPGGLVRIVVPNAQIWLNAYCNADDEFFRVTGEELGVAWSKSQKLRQILTYLGLRSEYEKNGHHRMAYDWPQLEKILIDAGFHEPIKSAFNMSRDLVMKVDNYSKSARIKVKGQETSLFAEATS